MVKHTQTIRQQIASEIGSERANIEHALSRVFNVIDSRQRDR